MKVSDFKITTQDSIIVVDVQNDFCIGGALPVPEADDSYVDILNGYIDSASSIGARVIFTKDWHPPNHCSFKEQGGPWPPHCVAGAWGSDLHKLLHVPSGVIHINKGTEADVEQYSGFDTERLKNLPVLPGNIFIVGIAFEYCVFATAVAAQNYLSEEGSVILIKEGTRSIAKDDSVISAHIQKLDREPRIIIK